MVTRAARGQVERHRPAGDLAAQRIDEGVQGVADHRRLLEDLLLHEVAVLALADHGAGERGLDRPRARPARPSVVEDLRAPSR